VVFCASGFGSNSAELAKATRPFMSAVPPIPTVNSMRRVPKRSASCKAIGSICLYAQLTNSLHLSGTFQISIFARVRHDQRCSEPDGNDARDVPGEPSLLT
jgi:hypothetical protein